LVMITEQFELDIPANDSNYMCAITKIYDEDQVYYVIGIGEPGDNTVAGREGVHAYILKMKLNCETGQPNVYDYNVPEIPLYVKEIEQKISDILCSRV
jgi:hypothetical protein